MNTDDGETPIFASKLEQAQEQLSALLGERTLLQFRRDISNIYEELHEETEVTAYKKRKWVTVGRRGLDETKSRYLTIEKGLNWMDISDAFLSLALFLALRELASILNFPIFPSTVVAFLLSTFLYFMNTGLLFGKALINRLAFPKSEIHTRLPAHELQFRAGWNKGVLQSGTSLIGMLVFGLVTSPDSVGYRIGLNVVKEYQKRKRN